MKLKEFYQYKRELNKYNKSLYSRSLLKERLFGTKQSFTLSSGLLYVKTTMNNTIITLSNTKGKVNYIRSCGCLGFLGKKKRSTKFAIESTIFQVLHKVKEYGWKSVVVFLSGFGQGRFYLQNCFKKVNVKLSFVKDVTGVPHNGCRPRKLRRG